MNRLLCITYERRKISVPVATIATALLLILVAGCADTNSPAAPALLNGPDAASMEALVPMWDNGITTGADLRIFIEPYCHTTDCRQAIRETIPALVERTDAHVRIYDYPLSQESKSFLFSGIGWCIADESACAYLEYLQRSLDLSDAYDNNVEMQALSKSVIGDYNTRCINGHIREIQKQFENSNPLELDNVPALVIDGRIAYGAFSEKQVDALLIAGADQ